MRLFPRLIAVAVLAMVLSGCESSGDATHMPHPTAAPSLISSASPGIDDAPDVAGAKQAFLDYVAAVNAIDLSDRGTIDNLLSRTTGRQLKTDTELYDQLSAASWTVEGAIRVTILEPRDGSTSIDSITFAACTDVSGVHYFDSSGVERIPPDPSDTAPSLVTMIQSSNESWVVSEIAPRSGEPKC